LSAHDCGFNLKAEANPKKAHALKGTKAQIKYRDGDDTWSGRGKTPNWLSAKLSAGASKEQFAVNSNGVV
jgi:DNA-binding protein H-NS